MSVTLCGDVSLWLLSVVMMMMMMTMTYAVDSGHCSAREARHACTNRRWVESTHDTSLWQFTYVHTATGAWQ